MRLRPAVTLLAAELEADAVRAHVSDRGLQLRHCGRYVRHLIRFHLHQIGAAGTWHDRRITLSLILSM